MPDTSSLSGLQARVDALERQTARLKRQVFAVLTAFLCLGTLAATAAGPKSVSFSGAKGTVRVDATGLHILGRNGKEQVLFGFTSAATLPAVRFYDPSGAQRMIVGLDTASNGILRDYSDTGDSRVELDGNGVMNFYDQSGVNRMFVGLTTSNTGAVMIYNASDKLQSELEDDYLRLGDSNATEREYIGVTDTNESIVKLWDTDHTERNFMGTYSDGSSGFSAFAATGTASWTSP